MLTVVLLEAESTTTGEGGPVRRGRSTISIQGILDKEE